MRKFLIAAAAVALASSPALAQTQTQENREQGQAALAGTTAGAIGGAIVAGPVGAIVGGFLGGAIGGAAAAPEPVVQYVVANPVEPVTVEGEITEGHVVPESVTLAEVPGYDDYAYFYGNGRPIIVNRADRAIVYAPPVYPQEMISYVRENPVEPLTLEGRLEVGGEVPADVELRPIPNYKGYSYVYYDGRPYIVRDDERRVVFYVQ